MFVNITLSANHGGTSVEALRLSFHFRLSVRRLHVEKPGAFFIIFYANFSLIMSPAGLMLSAVHAIISVNQYILTFLVNLLKTLTFSLKSPKSEDVRRDAKSIRKLPVHVGIMLAEEEVCLADVAKIVVWCFTVGISHISVYDSAGSLIVHILLKVCIR